MSFNNTQRKNEYMHNTSMQYTNNSIQGRKRATRNNNRRNPGKGRRTHKNNRHGRRAVYNDRLGSQLLPSVNNKPIQTRCFRYQGTINETATFTSQDLRCIMGAVTSASTVFYPLIDGFQINRVGMTLMPNSTTTAGTVVFSWQGFNCPDIRETLLVANAIPFHKSFIPPEGTSPWFWWDNSSTTTNLFSIESGLATGCVIFLDFDLKYILNSGAITSTALSVNSTFTGIGYRELPIGDLSFSPTDLDVVH
jgi:hypothetical protein